MNKLLQPKDIPYNDLPLLPPERDLESKAVLKKAIRANAALAELRGWSFNQSNPLLLLQSLTLQEAKSSSAIENVVTTNDELYQALATPEDTRISPPAKEVLHYKEALWHGYQKLKDEYPLSIRLFVELFQIIKQRSDGIRSIPGTVLKNSFGETVYTPPDHPDDIMRLLTNLEKYMNDDQDDIDPVIKLAVMHYQFECIHPFPDGNGRVGRILNVLYLVKEKLLTFPILYLSDYIIRNKPAYYHALKGVTESENWEAWILYMLDAVEETAKKTLATIQDIYWAQRAIRQLMKEKTPEIYSKELVELLFEQPYCKIAFLVERGICKKQTASRYLSKLCDAGILHLMKRGRENYYINISLWGILTRE